MLAKATVTALLPALALIVSGCVAPNAAEVGGPGPEGSDGSSVCDIEYPDGSAFECGTSRVATAIAEGRPQLGSGWKCISHWRENDDDLGLFEVYMHDDGRAGLYWESVPFKNPGFDFVVANVFESATKGTALVVNWSAKGFAVFPEKPPSTAEVHLVARNLFLDVKDGEGEWKPDENATLSVGQFVGHDWFVWTFDAGGKMQHEDTIVPKVKEGSLRKWTPGKKHFEGDGWSAFSTVGTWGIKYTTFSFTAGSTTAICPVSGVVGGL